MRVLRLLRDRMSATRLSIGNETEPFWGNTGAKQCCVIAPTLFSIFISEEKISWSTPHRHIQGLVVCVGCRYRLGHSYLRLQCSPTLSGAKFHTFTLFEET